MKNSFSNILPFLLIADLIIPFVLAPTCNGVQREHYKI